MITPDNLPGILSDLAWPIFALFLILLFQNEIRALFKRLQKAKLPGGAEASFGYGDASIDKPIPQTPTATKPSQATRIASSMIDPVKWDNSGNLFWIGHDLMWTVDVLLRGAPRDTIVHGLRQSLHHARSLGFANVPVESRLAKLKSEAENSLERDWTASHRNIFANELTSVIGEIGSLAQAHQPDFKPSPNG